MTAARAAANRHLNAADDAFWACRQAEDRLAELYPQETPSVVHYPLGQLARGLWHTAIGWALSRIGGGAA